MAEIPDVAATRSAFDTARPRPAPAPVPWPVLGVISLGGVLGALARYGLGVAYPHGPTGFPWATFAVNVSGCLLIGVLMVFVGEIWPGRTLLRPFLGTGVLGGYTTFSTAMVDVVHLAAAGAGPTAVGYLVGTLLAALAAVHTGLVLTRLALTRLVLTRLVPGRARRTEGER